jgi:hypothetical protein
MMCGGDGISWASTWSCKTGVTRQWAAAGLLLGGGLLAVALVWGAARLSARGDRAADPRAVLDRYCVDCHNSSEWAGGVAFDRLSLDAVHDGADEWERAVRKVRTGFMPPAGEPRPPRPELDRFAAAIEARLDRAAAAAPNPGAEGLSRLNRAEYANAVRDLLDYDAGRIVAALPADDAIQGFDNIAAALTVSPTLIESYVNAAMKISRAAVGDRSLGPTQVTYDVPTGLSQTEHIDGLPLGTRGGLKFTHDFPLDATYELRVGTRRAGLLSAQRFCAPPSIDVTLDGKPLDVDDPSAFRLRVAAGPRTVTVALLDERRCEGVNELYGVYAPGGGVENVTIHGPFEPTGTGETPSRRAIFTCHPQTGRDEVACAREILTRLATRAYRRPLQAGDAEIDTLMSFYDRGRREGDF